MSDKKEEPSYGMYIFLAIVFLVLLFIFSADNFVGIIIVLGAIFLLLSMFSNDNSSNDSSDDYMPDNDDTIHVEIEYFECDDSGKYN